MTIDEIFENLCCYDSRNPYSIVNSGVKPQDPCMCDNCFYSRTKMALEILKYRDKLDRYERAAEKN